ncbi:TetR/AcrR family transcriptional regulator [Micromonospora sp. DT233]|uniref:TetR/AcrR family transcriptional regulator n=1 Tax=Micromonospora sp. DT233 TaxID=3393432 RepID=UPI003CF93DAC
MTHTRAESPHTPVPARRHGRVLEQAIFDAVIEQLEKFGYAKLTMDSVAAAAHTGKATLYRRWADKDELILDAFYNALPSPVAIPLRGVLRTDLAMVLRSLRDAFDATRGAAFQIVKSENGPKAAMVHTMVKERVTDPCKKLLLDILRDGVERGEVRADAVTPLVANVGSAMMIYHSLTEGPVSDDMINNVVDGVLLPLISPRPPA